ncbi:MAG TPA: glycosyltransferase family 4 protein [Candidatus Obscuribacterales bacterium]
MATAAFYYHPDGYETRRKELMGRHAAGEAFLHAYVQHAGQDKLYCYAQTQKHYNHFVSKVRDRAEKPLVCSWIPWGQWTRLTEPGCLFMPGPVLKDLSWQRRHGDTRAYSVCGITHTTATQTVMDALGDLLVAPVQPWDALICTSASVKTMVTQLSENHSQYLQQHFGLPASPSCRVQLPVIPLGVNCDDLDKSAEQRAAARHEWREKLKIPKDAVAFLFVGRLSSYGKAHPVPMFLALEEAAKSASVPIDLILAGWFNSKAMEEDFIAAAREFCPSTIVHIVDGRTPEVRSFIWYAADVFTSLSDNIQETFGLTPIEAMAAGLPSVVSDWNGYKETIKDGIDGFRVPTWMAAPGMGEKLAFGHAIGVLNYDQYIGCQSQFTSVDVHAAAQAYLTLANDAALRKEMGEAARRRARAEFDWRVIIPAYDALWSELAEIRKRAPEVTPRVAGQPANPLRDDPTRLFRSYPTHYLEADTAVAKTSACNTDLVSRLKRLSINNIADGIAADRQQIERMISKLDDDASPVKTVLSTIPDAEKRNAALSLLWLAKMGMVELNERAKARRYQRARAARCAAPTFPS